MTRAACSATALLLALCMAWHNAMAMQLLEVPTQFNSGSAANQKFVIMLRPRAANSRLDAEELARLTHESRVQVMTTPNGQRYTCRIPLRAPPPSAAAAADALQAASEQASEGEPGGPSSDGSLGGAGATTATPSTKSPAELLDQLRSLCLFRQEGLWTYEVCYKKHTRQFRQAMQRIVGNGQPEAIPAEDFSCGSMATDQDFSIRHDSSATGIPMTYISHNLTGGAPCIMTGIPRSSEVRFTCMPHAKDNLLVLVKEFPTCNYIFVVATPFLCSHPEFQPPPQRTHTLRCLLQEPVHEESEAHEEGRGPHGSPPPAAAATAVQAEPAGQCGAGEGGASTGGTCTSEGAQGEGGALEGAEEVQGVRDGRDVDPREL